MTKLTFEGKVIENHVVLGPNAIFCDDGLVQSPTKQLIGMLELHHGRTVRVSIEVEPITLKDRIEKIFDDEWDHSNRTGTLHLMDHVKKQVLAEIQEEELDKHE